MGKPIFRPIGLKMIILSHKNLCLATNWPLSQNANIAKWASRKTYLLLGFKRYSHAVFCMWYTRRGGIYSTNEFLRYVPEIAQGGQMWLVCHKSHLLNLIKKHTFWGWRTRPDINKEAIYKYNIRTSMHGMWRARAAHSSIKIWGQCTVFVFIICYAPFKYHTFFCDRAIFDKTFMRPTVPQENCPTKLSHKWKLSHKKCPTPTLCNARVLFMPFLAGFVPNLCRW